MMQSILQYFKWPILATLVSLPIIQVFLGFEAALQTAILISLEISLSFDNAVVNATVLKSWDNVWRKAFLVIGLPIAVFGMRFLFPMLIVAGTSDLSVIEAAKLAFNSPEEYSKAVTSSHDLVAAFGGTFLFMVFWEFFLDEEKSVHWIAWLEKPLQTLSKLGEAFSLLILVGTAYAFDLNRPLSFIVSGIMGVILYLLVRKVGSLAEGTDMEGASAVVKQGIGGLLYLEVLDASFSFDGVIGAFALTNNVIIMAIGLGIGAWFVRELTIFFLDKGVTDAYKYLEHGAFWAIGILAALMFLSVHIEIPEVVTGLIGAGVLALAVITSPKKSEKESQL